MDIYILLVLWVCTGKNYTHRFSSYALHLNAPVVVCIFVCDGVYYTDPLHSLSIAN